MVCGLNQAGARLSIGNSVSRPALSSEWKKVGDEESTTSTGAPSAWVSSRRAGKVRL
ncbi:hypothetical protein D3C81_2279800 [compost metagenome]